MYKKCFNNLSVLILLITVFTANFSTFAQARRTAAANVKISVPKCSGGTWKVKLENTSDKELEAILATWNNAV